MKANFAFFNMSDRETDVSKKNMFGCFPCKYNGVDQLLQAAARFISELGKDRLISTQILTDDGSIRSVAVWYWESLSV